MSTEKELPKLAESSKNWGKIKDKDKWLDEVRGNDEKELSAMQDAIVYCDKVVKFMKGKYGAEEVAFVEGISEELISLLPKEKAQIVDALDALEGLILGHHFTINFDSKQEQSKYNDAIKKAKEVLVKHGRLLQQ